jgi:hypothetical protein
MDPDTDPAKISSTLFPWKDLPALEKKLTDILLG